jgi:hypothetical protein
MQGALKHLLEVQRKVAPADEEVGRHIQRQEARPSCMVVEERHSALLQDDYLPGAVDMRKTVACKHQEVPEVDMDHHCTPGEDTERWLGDMDVPGWEA